MENTDYKDALVAATKSSAIISLAAGNKTTSGVTQEQQLVVNVKLLNSNLTQMSSSIKRIVGIFERVLVEKNKERYLKEEQIMEQRERLASIRVAREDSQPGMFGNLLKSFFTNPAIIAGFSGLAYLLLPKDVKDKIHAFFKGFASGVGGLENASTELKTALGIAAAGLGTYFGAKLLANIASALATTLALINVAATTIKKPFRGRSSRVVKGAVAVGALGAAGAAGATGFNFKESLPELPKDVAEVVQQSYTAMTGGEKTYPEGSSAGAAGATGAATTGGEDSTKSFIKENEGLSLVPYKDSLGLWHVGYGHLIGDGKTLPKEYNRKFTREEAEALFEKDYARHKKAAENIPNFNKLNDSGKTALIDLTYNMGPNWYKKWPRFTAAMEKGDINGAIASLERSKWYSQVGARAPKVISLLRSSSIETSTKPISIPAVESAPRPIPTETGAAEVSSFEGQPVTAKPTGKPDLSFLTGFLSVSREASKKLAEGEKPAFITAISNLGEKFREASESLDVPPETQDTNVINNFNNSRELSSRPDIAPPGIPSPSTDRGSLSERTKHQTAQ